MNPTKLEVESIWWRNMQPGEFYNIERYPQIKGGGGSLYIEIPSSMVPETLEFLEVSGEDIDHFPPIRIEARVIGAPHISGPIEFQRKKGGRLRIARQNRRQASSERHPAWTERYGFPRADDSISNREEALKYFPEGGLRIYVVKTRTGDYYAGHTKGPRPGNMKVTDPMWDLYPEGRVVGGVITTD